MKYFRFLLPTVLLIVLFSVSSCKKQMTCKERTDMESSVIENYLSKKGLKDKAVKTEEGLYFIIENAGSGSKPNINSQVTVNYKGYFTDDTEFDKGANVSFYLSEVIQGWQIGMQKFTSGGKGKLFVPSCYGYGENPPSGSKIPKNSILIFDIDLLSVK